MYLSVYVHVWQHLRLLVPIHVLHTVGAAGAHVHGLAGEGYVRFLVQSSGIEEANPVGAHRGMVALDLGR